MSFSDLILKDPMFEAKLDQLEIVHQLWVLDDVLDNIFLVLVNFELLDDTVELLQLFNVVRVQLLAIKCSQDLNEGSLRQIWKLDDLAIGSDLLEKL